ncbi:hypothetical protein [Pseudomonas sp.]|uniref:hypothetical protein n=1 Tax=Pseudomonas sp. TaxID=306 RepID=UPI0028B08679|nr:hypothetical protein [Pseudomonas sp.]
MSLKISGTGEIDVLLVKLLPVFSPLARLMLYTLQPNALVFVETKESANGSIKKTNTSRKI